MSATYGLDHVHLLSKDPQATAAWYADKFDAEILRRSNATGTPQVAVSFGEFLVIVRGQRPGEQPREKEGLAWGIDHFGLRVREDFDGFCETLRKKNVVFSMEPKDLNPTTRIAFIEAPDGVTVELVNRRKSV